MIGEFIAFDDDLEIEEKKKKAGSDEEGGEGGGGFATARSRRYFFANIARGGRGGGAGGTDKKKPGAGGGDEKKTEPERKRSEIIGERLDALKSDPSYRRKVEAEKEVEDLRKKYDSVYEELSKSAFDPNLVQEYNKRFDDASKIRDTIKQKNAEIEMLNNDLRGKYVEAMKVDHPATLSASYVSIGAKRKKDFEDMRSDMEKIISSEKFPTPGNVQVDGRRGTRANYQRGVSKVDDKWVNTGRINIKVGDTTVYAHEYGHHLETSPGVHEKVMGFYNRRTAGEKAVHLGPGYGRSEVTKKDKFIHPYMGKVYPNASEILSMGIQHLMTDPIGLREKDQDYFDTMIDILQ